MNGCSERRAHWNRVAESADKRAILSSGYHQRLRAIYRLLIPAGRKVLELGCAEGDLLASLYPSFGVGVDFAVEAIRKAADRHPGLHFICADAHDVCLKEKFDFIILSDLVDDLWDVQAVLENIAHLTTSRTRIIINSYSRLWELPLNLARKAGQADPILEQNWLTVEDMTNLLGLTNFEVIRHGAEILWPIRTPVIDRWMNRFLVKLWPFKHLALTNVIVARPRPDRDAPAKEPTVSVIVPARNEAGNIPSIFERIPEMGGGTELIFVEGHSRDNTCGVIEAMMASRPGRRVRLYRQAGVGKGDAVRTGFAHASGDVLMILDADLTVVPEDLPRFYEALRSGKGDFINGVRLVYPLEKQSMRFFNILGNKFFSLVFSWLLGQPIKDTLCGTKVLWKEDYERIARNRSAFGDFDPFGDFDLLFGAAKENMKIIDLPVRYRERRYGETNIQRWRHGWLLLRMTFFAAKRIKFT
jgi:hypothetical protein